MKSKIRYFQAGILAILTTTMVAYWCRPTPNSAKDSVPKPEKNDLVWFRPMQDILVAEDTILPALDPRIIWQKVLRADQQVRDSLHMIS